MTAQDETTAVPSVAEQIRSWLPDHAHEDAPGFLAFGDRVWSWSTPEGVWSITWPVFSPRQRLRGPGGTWDFDRSPAGASKLHGVLVALDAIEVPR